MGAQLCCKVLVDINRRMSVCLINNGKCLNRSRLPRADSLGQEKMSEFPVSARVISEQDL